MMFPPYVDKICDGFVVLGGDMIDGERLIGETHRTDKYKYVLPVPDNQYDDLLLKLNDKRFLFAYHGRTDDPFHRMKALQESGKTSSSFRFIILHGRRQFKKDYEHPY